MTDKQKPKGDKRVATVPWYFIAVPEADDVSAGNKTLSELFALGSTKFDKDGNQTNGISLTKDQLAQYGIEVSVMGTGNPTSGDQYARVQLPADWMSGECKGYKIEVGVDDVVHGYSNVMHRAGAGALDAKIKVSDETWFNTESSHVMIRIRRGKDDLEVARFKIAFDPEGDTPFMRDFADMELYDQYEYMIRRGHDALTAFQKSRKVSAPEMSVTAMMRAIRKDGYTFHVGAQGYRVVTRRQAYEDGVKGGQYQQNQLDNVNSQCDQDKAQNWFVVQVLNADGSAGAIVRDAQDAVDFDTKGHMALYMPNHAGTNNNTKLYIGELGARVYNKDIPINVPEDATDAEKAKARAEVLEGANRPQMLWGGYDTPDKTRDGIGKKKGDDFAPQHLATVEELQAYLTEMKDAQAHCHLRGPGQGDQGDQGDQDAQGVQA